MALLMLTFKLADTYKKKDGIKINAVEIPAVKMSKESIRKFKSIWRIAARIQKKVFSTPPETMADIYFHICTSEEFKDITGKLINDKKKKLLVHHIIIVVSYKK